MTEIIIALMLNLMIGSPAETTSTTQDEESTEMESVDSMGGSGAWVTTEK